MLIAFIDDEVHRIKIMGCGPFLVKGFGEVAGLPTYKLNYTDLRYKVQREANLYQCRFKVVKDDQSLDDLL